MVGARSLYCVDCSADGPKSIPAAVPSRRASASPSSSNRGSPAIPEASRRFTSGSALSMPPDSSNPFRGDRR
jgi:hypothetical protein